MSHSFNFNWFLFNFWNKLPRAQLLARKQVPQEVTVDRGVGHKEKIKLEMDRFLSLRGTVCLRIQPSGLVEWALLRVPSTRSLLPRPLCLPGHLHSFGAGLQCGGTSFHAIQVRSLQILWNVIWFSWFFWYSRKMLDPELGNHLIRTRNESIRIRIGCARNIPNLLAPQPHMW